MPALRLYLEHTGAEHGWTFDVVDGLSAEPPSELRATLYRIAQEAVANVRKHAEASHVAISVATAGDGVTVKVVDNGRGFEPARVAKPEPGHLGLCAVKGSLAGYVGWEPADWVGDEYARSDQADANTAHHGICRRPRAKGSSALFAICKDRAWPSSMCRIGWTRSLIFVSASRSSGTDNPSPNWLAPD